MRQIMLQPNGKLAVYSTVVHGIVLCDATPADVANEAADFARDTASPNATPEQINERIRHARETARTNAAHVAAGEPHRAYEHPLSWLDIVAMATPDATPR